MVKSEHPCSVPGKLLQTGSAGQRTLSSHRNEHKTQVWLTRTPAVVSGLAGMQVGVMAACWTMTLSVGPAALQNANVMLCELLRGFGFQPVCPHACHWLVLLPLEELGLSE